MPSAQGRPLPSPRAGGLPATAGDGAGGGGPREPAWPDPPPGFPRAPPGLETLGMSRSMRARRRGGPAVRLAAGLNPPAGFPQAVLDIANDERFAEVSSVTWQGRTFSLRSRGSDGLRVHVQLAARGRRAAPATPAEVPDPALWQPSASGVWGDRGGARLQAPAPRSSQALAPGSIAARRLRRGGLVLHRSRPLCLRRPHPRQVLPRSRPRASLAVPRWPEPGVGQAPGRRPLGALAPHQGS